MDGKRRQQDAVVVSERAAQASLRRGPAPPLAADEERVLRMRLGASLPLTARLERIAAATDAEIDLLAIEIEAFLHAKRSTPALNGRPPAPTASRAKEKIVRALRKKG